MRKRKLKQHVVAATTAIMDDHNFPLSYPHNTILTKSFTFTENIFPIGIKVASTKCVFISVGNTFSHVIQYLRAIVRITFYNISM
jgi:hypothetical protein